MLGAVLLVGCAQTIPYRASLDLDIPGEEKRADELTIRMSEELRHLVVTVKPINLPGAIAYKFRIGGSLEANLTSALRALFATVHVSTLPLSELGAEASVLEVELEGYDLHIARTILGTHSAKLEIRYSVYGAGRRRLFTLETKSEGASAMSSAERTERFRANYRAIYNAPGYRRSIGRAYDQALAQSIDKLASKMVEVLAR